MESTSRRAGSAGRLREQLAENDSRQGLVRDPTHVRPAAAVDRQDLAAGRDRAGRLGPGATSC